MASQGFVWPLTGRRPHEIMNCDNAKRHGKPVANQQAQIRDLACTQGPEDAVDGSRASYFSAAGPDQSHCTSRARRDQFDAMLPLAFGYSTGRRLGRVVGRCH